MKDKLITAIQANMASVLNLAQQEELRRVLAHHLHNVEVTERKVPNPQETAENGELIEVFIAAKRVEGCSDKSLKYYDSTIRHMTDSVKKPTREITTDDLRVYLADYQKERNSSKVTIDNIRRIFSSFFGWLEDEDYILKSPSPNPQDKGGQDHQRNFHRRGAGTASRRLRGGPRLGDD